MLYVPRRSVYAELIKRKIYKHFDVKDWHERLVFLTTISAVLLIFLKNLYYQSLLHYQVLYIRQLFQRHREQRCFFKKMFYCNDVAFGKMVTESRTVFYQRFKKFFRVIKRANSIAIVCITFLDRESIVKKFNKGDNGNSIHRHRK